MITNILLHSLKKPCRSALVMNLEYESMVFNQINPPMSFLFNALDWYYANQYVVTGVIVYIMGMILMNNIEVKFREQMGLPTFSDEVRIKLGYLTKEEEKTSWIEPSYTQISIPTVEELKQNDIYIGSIDDVNQYISYVENKDTRKDITGVIEYSEAWSSVLECDVIIYKKRQ